MAFNFEDVINSANQALQNSGSSYKYSLMYPGTGTLTVKLLFNPASNSVLRLVNRHTIGDKKIACMKTYGKDCPICKAIEDVKNAKNIDLGKMGSKIRGIAFAQYVESTYKVDDRIHKGDVVLLMYPWSVYKDISQILSQVKTPQELESLIAQNEGFVFNINRGIDNKYSTQVSPFSKYRSCGSDEEFVNLLNGLESLNEQVLPSVPDDNMKNDIIQASNEITQTYLVSKGPQYATNPTDQQSTNLGGFMQNQQSPASGFMNVPEGMPLPFATQTYHTTPTPAPTTAPQTQTSQSNTNVDRPDGAPECFGKHGSVDQNQCLLCPHEIVCQQNTK
jgi:hypothetical protein